MTNSVEDRLLNGARILGRLWQEGVRCPEVFALCVCAAPTQFCKAKRQWWSLHGQSSERTAHIDATDYCLIENMTVQEFEATGLTLTLDVPELGAVKVGAKGDLPLAALAGLGGTEALKTVLAVLKKFPGAEVVK